MAKDTDRFQLIYKDGSMMREGGTRHILVDKETGVHYLLWKEGYAGGITPLLDEKGNVIVNKNP